MNWSYSALTTLRRCNRQYYFGYIASSHYFTDLYRRKIFELKNSKSLIMWQGSVIDYIVETEIIGGLRQGSSLNFSQIAQKAVELAQRQFRFSQNYLYRNKGVTKSSIGADYCILDIHESNKSYSTKDIDDVYERIYQVINNFSTLKNYNNDLLMSDYISQFSMIYPNVRFVKFEFENIRVTPQIDLLLNKGNKSVIIDWKVSESDVSNYSMQLVMAGIAVLHSNQVKFGKAFMRPADIELYEVNLLTHEVKKHPFTSIEINQTVDYIFLNADETAFLNKQDSQKQSAKDYLMTDKVSTCQFCKFRSMCSFLIMNNYEYDEHKYIEFVQSSELK